MNIIKTHNLTCPIDGKRLKQQDKQLICEQGHAYDIARQGYVNLLPVQHKRSKQPGDSKAMVVGRTQFLDSGIYKPIADKLNEIVLPMIARETCLLDAGCGEGYYFDEVLKFLEAHNVDNGVDKEVSFVGLDISKDAVLAASKRNKQISWVVGTNRQPPVEDNSIDIILCLFGFLSVDGFSKILKPGGKIILVDPGLDHLKELREIIYPEVKTTDKTASSEMQLTGFTLVKTESLCFRANIPNNEQINNLLIMTPHFYRASKEGRELACALPELDITVDVVFRIFELDDLN